MTLPASAAERRSAAPLLLSAGACYRSISPAAGRSAANPPHAAVAVDRWDRQMDRRTLERFTDPAPHTVRVVSVSNKTMKYDSAI